MGSGPPGLPRRASSAQRALVVALADMSGSRTTIGPSRPSPAAEAVAGGRRPASRCVRLVVAPADRSGSRTTCPGRGRRSRLPVTVDPRGLLLPVRSPNGRMARLCGGELSDGGGGGGGPKMATRIDSDVPDRHPAVARRPAAAEPPPPPLRGSRGVPPSRRELRDGPVTRVAALRHVRGAKGARMRPFGPVRGHGGRLGPCGPCGPRP